MGWRIWAGALRRGAVGCSDGDACDEAREIYIGEGMAQQQGGGE